MYFVRVTANHERAERAVRAESEGAALGYGCGHFSSDAIIPGESS
jgi:hypothetical protein